MKGILAISHGTMAEGLLDTARFVLGDGIEQVGSCCLEEGESPDHFGQRLSEKLRALDTGDGVIVVADLFGGTPCNQAIMQLREGVDLIAGINFPTLMELLMSRLSGEADLSSIIATGQQSLVDVRESLAQTDTEGDE